MRTLVLFLLYTKQTAWLILDKFSDIGSKKRIKYPQQTIDGTSCKKLGSRNTEGCLCERREKNYFRGMNSHQIYLALNVNFYSSKGIFQIEQKMHANIGYIDNKNKTAKGS